MKQIRLIFKSMWRLPLKRNPAPCDAAMMAVTDAVDHPEMCSVTNPALQGKVENHRHIGALLKTCYDPVLTEPVPDHLRQLAIPSPAPAATSSRKRSSLLVMPRHWAYAASVLICAFSVMAGFGAAQILSSAEQHTSPVLGESDSASESIVETTHAAPIIPYTQATQATAQPSLYEAGSGIAPAVDGTVAGHGNETGIIAPFVSPAPAYEPLQPLPPMQPAMPHMGEEESL